MLPAIGNMKILRNPFKLHSVPKQNPLPDAEGMKEISQVRFHIGCRLDRPTLNILMPSLCLARMTGGPNTIINIAMRAASQGVPLRFFSCYKYPDPDLTGLVNHVEQLTGIDSKSVNITFSNARLGLDSFVIGPNDIFCATHWVTAHIANRGIAYTNRKRFIYIIQDYEPGFYPWSSEYAMALETYNMDFLPIVNESTLRDYLVFQHQQCGRFHNADVPTEGEVFQPAVDRSRFYPEPCAGYQAKKFLFYARPGHRRFLYEVGLRALKTAVSQGTFSDARWNFISIGASIPDVVLDEDHVLINKPWLAYDDYAALIRTADIMLSLTLSPHTSYPPLEAAACGTSVVTNTFATKTTAALTALSPDIIGAEPNAEAITIALATAKEYVSATVPRRDRLTLPGDWDSAVGSSASTIRDFVLGDSRY